MNAKIERLLLQNKKEGAVLAEVCRFLESHAIPYGRTASELAYNARGQRVARVAQGWPDITAVQPGSGRLLAIECKRPTNGRLSYEQARVLLNLHQAGALVVIARSWLDVQTVVTGGRAIREHLQEIHTALSKGPRLNKRRAAQRILVEGSACNGCK